MIIALIKRIHCESFTYDFAGRFGTPNAPPNASILERMKGLNQEESGNPGKNARLRLLVVSRDRELRDAVRNTADAMGFACESAESTQAGQRHLAEAMFDVVLMELSPGETGLGALVQIRSDYPRTLVVIASEDATVQFAVEVMRQGALDLIGKPLDQAELRAALERAAGAVTLAEEHRLLREHVKEQQSLGNLICRSSAMQQVYRTIAKVARSRHPVMINGESGTGKELVARQIHFSGPNADKPFLPVDCGALVPTLIESELFGYVKGAFTGAHRAKEGLLQIANGGTVFLDEIAELPTDLQSKLLRALQEREIRPVGSTKTVPLNVRILAATHRDLEQAVQHGTFRKDLYFRLNVVHLRIPPLRERQEDIPALIEYFLDKINRNTGIERTLAPEALAAMLRYDWPGNVRELENVVERAGALTSGPLIQVSDLPTQLQAVAPASDDPAYRMSGILPIAEMEKQVILAALQRSSGDKLKAARLLGIGKTTIYRKLKEYGYRR